MAIDVGGTLSANEQLAVRRMVEEEWTSAILANDLERTLALCAEDIVYMPADMPVLRGRASLREWLGKFPKIVDFKQPVHRVEGHGDLAIVCATFVLSLETEAGRVNNGGKVLCSFRRETNGRWLVNAVCWNWDQRTPAA